MRLLVMFSIVFLYTVVVQAESKQNPSLQVNNETKILFGSCLHQDKPAPILSAINNEQADLFVFLGDNIYGDTEDMAVLKNKYNKLKSKSEFNKLRNNTKTIAMWDDHDYGKDDAGSEYAQKESSRQVMLDFWGEPKESPRRSQPNGIYTSYWLEDSGRKIQIILPDLRWNRDELRAVNELEYFTKKAPNNLGPYLPSQEKQSSMLGAQQWQWLEAELKKPADLKILGSSIQVLADFTGWESWANFPKDRYKLLEILKKNNIKNLILVSGDTHWGEFSRFPLSGNRALWEMTTSGLTEKWKNVSPNKHRIGDFTNKVNYGEIRVNWFNNELSLGLKDVKGVLIMEKHFSLTTSPDVVIHDASILSTLKATP